MINVVLSIHIMVQYGWFGRHSDLFLDGSASISELLTAYKKLRTSPERIRERPYDHAQPKTEFPANPKISIIIPTVNRYPYLWEFLSQLRTQTIAPYEIIVVDQTPEISRNRPWKIIFLISPFSGSHLSRLVSALHVTCITKSNR